MLLPLRPAPTSGRPRDGVAVRVPTSVSTAFALWMVALAAGLFETALAVRAVAVGWDGSGWAAAIGQVTVRTAAFTVLFLLARAMRTGTGWARAVLAGLFGVLGTLSLAVGPVIWLATGGSILAYRDADRWELAFAASRVIHVLSVWGAIASMFRPSATRFFARAAAARRRTAFSTASADGISVRGYDQGQGPAIVMLGPGLDDGTRCRKIAELLARQYRVICLHRRPYRLDIPVSARSITHDVDDVLAAAHMVGEPVVLYGHSDGAVIALEALRHHRTRSPEL